MSAESVTPDVSPRPRSGGADGSRFVELTRHIVERMVGAPEAVSVRAVPRGRSTIVEVQVAETDKGKLIGKGGRNIDAVRAVVRAAGLRGGQRIQVELAGRR
jgi:predicted RNA-binding protein YlqC (UPF0109 family)